MAWKARYLSLGGRIVLINSVLASLPVYYFSVYKAPSTVIKSLIKIQKKFLWDGNNESRGIRWVKWKDVCRKKEEGGLGIKNLRWFNFSLLAKWRWKSLKGEGNLWAEILVSRYGEGVRKFGSNDVGRWDREGSIWWRDVCKVVKEGLGWEGWFGKGIQKAVGDGRNTLFWEDLWNSHGVMKVLFSRLYSLTNCKNKVIADCGSLGPNGWEWNFTWRRRFFEWEKDSLAMFFSLLEGLRFRNGAEDEWRWLNGKDGMYTTQTAYDSLSCHDGIVGDQFFKDFWCNLPPLKVSAFAWKLVRGRIPTKDQIARRRGGSHGMSMECVLCRTEMESADHLFFRCATTYGFWKDIHKWWGISTAGTGSGRSHFSQHAGLISDSRLRTFWKSCWFSVVWAIWDARNNIIFENRGFETLKVLDRIKFHLWLWIKARVNSNNGNFNQWLLDPKSCFL